MCNNRIKTGRSLFSSLFLVLIYSSMMIFFFYSHFIDLRHSISGVITLFYFNFILFMIFYTNKLGRWRNIYFSSMALFFVAYILWDLLVEGRGYMWITNEDILYSQAPQCNIVSLMNFFPLLFKRVDLFPSAVSLSILLILIFMLVGGLVFGRGVCSWICQFGGQDSLCSSITKKPKWKIKRVHSFFKYLPLAMLIFIVSHSFLTMTPTYCVWFCPFKTVTEFLQVNTGLRIFQTVIFIVLWLSLVIILPLLTKKRTQCSFLCPMGAYYSLTNRISPFYVKIHKDLCIGCGKCFAVCPTFSLTSKSLENGRADHSCTKCGNCFAACPQGAITYAVKGSRITSVNSIYPHFKWKYPKFGKFLSDILDPAVIFIFPIYSLSTFITFGYFSKVLEIGLGFMGV